MARENVGECMCPFCKTEQPVRKDKKNKHYINCNNCGIHQLALDGGQKWISDNATIYGVNPPAPKVAPVDEEKTQPNPSPPPAPEAKPARKRSSGPAPKAEPTPPPAAPPKPRGMADEYFK